MEENENQEGLVVANKNYSIKGFEGRKTSGNTITEVRTNITDSKQLFNLENNVDYMLNDCEGQVIRVSKVLIKRFEKPLKEPIVDEETGEVLKDKEYTMSCVIVDEDGKSYATGSKTFTIALDKYMSMQANFGIKEETFDIKIIKKKVGEKGNKALSFELV